MNAGYGRGYYRTGQLAQRPRRGRNWFNIVAVVGLGAAAIWVLWPRGNPLPDQTSRGGGKEPPSPPQPSSPNAPIASEAAGSFVKQVEDDTRARGFVSIKDYEDSVIASARQLQDAGAKVMFAPHLQHLTPRLAP